MEGRNALVLRDGTRLYLPSLDHSAEPSFLFAYNPNATLLYVIAADRPRGHQSTGLCSCARGRVEQVVRYVNAVFNQLHDLLDASAMVDPELD